MKRIRTAVAGCGKVSLGYIPDLQASPYAELTAVCDVRAETAAEAAGRFGVPRHYVDVGEMLEKERVELLVNLTSMTHHAPINCLALEAGCHVFCEKPLATTLEDALALADLSHDRGLALWCAPNTPISPAFRFMAERIRSGKLGSVHVAQGIYGHRGPDWGAWFYEKGGGALFDLGVYNVTTLTGLLGPVVGVAAMAGVAVPERTIGGRVVRVEAEDNAAVILDHGNCVYSTVQTGFVYRSQHRDGTIQIIGTEGAMAMEGFDWAPTGVHVFAEKGKPWDYYTFRGESYDWKSGASYMARCLATGERPLLGTGHAVHVMEVMTAALRSAKSGRRERVESVFPWPLV